jgi:heptosyltransferase III
MEKILLSRTDNIGDVLLSLPVAAYLKANIKDCHISFLSRDYVKDIVESYPEVDEFIDWVELEKLSTASAISFIKQRGFSTVVHIFPNHKIAHLCMRASIPKRIGTTRRLYHWWTCNEKINLSRKKTQLHEAELNLKLLKNFNFENTQDKENIIKYCRFKKQNPGSNNTRYLSSQKFNLLIHPGTNGNTKHWPNNYFCELIHLLPKEKFQIILTGSKKEACLFKELRQVEGIIDTMGKLSLKDLLCLIQNADGCLAHSTGPLHIAAFSGIKTLGLYPSNPQMSNKRWGPLGPNAEVISQSQDNMQDSDLSKIKVASVFNKITQWHR